MGRRDHRKSNQNPASLRLEWAGKITKGFFEFYNKEDRENIPVKRIRFVPLIERHAIGGFSKKHGVGLFSNEVDDIATQELILKKFQAGGSVELCRGIYKEMEGDRALHQCKYQKVVYAVIVKGDGLEPGTIARITLSGASVGPWFDLSDDERDETITITGSINLKNGDNEYRAPVYVVSKTTPEEEAMAEEAFEKVEAYIAGGPAAKAPATDSEPEPDWDQSTGDEEQSQESPETEEADEFSDDIPF